MKAAGHPVLKDVVLVGAGHSHVTVLRMFGMKPIPGVRLTLITREVHTPYSGMLPGLIAGHYGFDDAHIDTGPLARFAGARLYQDGAVELDLAGRRVICRSRPPVPYDLLSLNIGSTPNTAGVPGASEHAIPVKPIDGFLRRFEALQARVLARKGRSAVALVGAGAGGVELLLAVEHRLRQAVRLAGFDGGGLSFVLVSDDANILPSFPAAFRARFHATLAAHGIAVVTGAAVTAVEPDRLMLAGYGPLAADEILWTTEAAPARWLAKAGLPLDARGFLRVDQTLRVTGHDDVFAAGDTIAFSGREMPQSDVYAMGGEPQTALAIATVPFGIESKIEADLTAMMAGANEVLREAGCALVGGHTSEGAELALGFAVNGLVPAAAALRKGGLKPGDGLILTKPLGTGTLLAADMRGKAKARWVMAAIAHMIASNRKAADILRRHGVHAATDVTGFGLIGHLIEMVRASDVDATLAIERVPLLDGARETVALGIFSSLQPQNVRLRRAITDLAAAARHPRYPLLFDPQTAGGLLAAVPFAEAERCVTALRTAGYAGADLIGFVSARSATLEPITLDLTGERLAQAMSALHASRPRAQSLQKDTEQTAL